MRLGLQFDSFQVEYNLGGEPTPRYGFQVQWADAFQQTMLGVVRALPTASQSRSGVFSSSWCVCHAGQAMPRRGAGTAAR